MRSLLLVLGLAVAIVFIGCGSDDGTTSGGDPVVATLDISPESGTILTDFTFDAGASTFAADDKEYRWDFENDGNWDTDWSMTATAAHRYTFWEGDDFDTVEVKVEVRKGSTTDTAVDTLIVDTRHGQVLDSFVMFGPQNPRGLGSDGTHLWICDWGSPGTGRLFKYDTGTEDSLYSIPSPDIWPGGIEWDGNYICVRGHLRLRRVAAATGDVVNDFEVVYSARGSGLAWDGESFFLGSYREASAGGDGDIHEYAADGTHLGSYGSPRGSLQPTGLAFDGMHLWAKVIGKDTLYVLNPEDGDIIWQVPLADTEVRDMAFIDDYVWVMGYSGGHRLSRLVP